MNEQSTVAGDARPNDPEKNTEKNVQKHQQGTETQTHVAIVDSSPEKESKEEDNTDTVDNNNTSNANGRNVPQDVRIAVIGNVDSGKSTMIGVLTSGEFDDGRGLARSRILRHNHEQANGRTSCLSQHIMGFNLKKKPIHQPVSISATPKQKTAAWSTVFQQSKNIVTFIDLAGHEKYLKTTIGGLTGCFPDYAFIVVGANMGISKMTREHIQVAVALSIPLFVVITKIDISPEKILKHTVKTLVKLLRSPACNNKMPMIIRKKKEIRLLFEKDLYLARITPIFCVSAVKGDNVDKLNYFLSQLHPRTPWEHRKHEYVVEEKLDTITEQKPENENEHGNENGNTDAENKISENAKQTEKATEKEQLPMDHPHPAHSHPHHHSHHHPHHHDLKPGDDNYGELEIDETFAVRGVGIVVSGTVTGGRIYANQKLYLGPFTDCSFKEILVRSVHMKRCVVEDARAGESCSVSFRFVKRKEVVDRIMIRKGMVAVSDERHKPKPVWGFTATILVLHHPTTINEGYQPVVHCGNIRQTATIMKMSKHRLRSGDSALIDMRFLGHPEFLHCGRALIIREGSTKCIGKVVQLYPDYDVGLSDFSALEKKYLNRTFEVQAKQDGSGTATMIFDEQQPIVTKDDLHRLEIEMKELALKQKQMKEEKKRIKNQEMNNDDDDENIQQ